MTTIVNPKASNEPSAGYLSRNDLITRYGLALSTFQLIPGLVALYPFSSFDIATPAVLDISGNGLNLQLSDTEMGLYNSIIPMGVSTGGANYFFTPDSANLDIIGTESGIVTGPTGMSGLTIGGWFRSTVSNNSALAVKTANGNSFTNYPYGLTRTSGGNVVMGVRNSGGSANFTVSTPFVDSLWQFIVGRYKPGIELKIWCDDAPVVNTTSIPSSILTSTGELRVLANTFVGHCAFVFVAASAISDTLRTILFQQTYVLFK